MSKSAKNWESLNNQERRIVALVVQGLKDGEIASRMSITKKAVKDHIGNLFSKLRLGDRLELVFYVIEKNIPLIPASEQRERSSSKGEPTSPHMLVAKAPM